MSQQISKNGKISFHCIGTQAAKFFNISTDSNTFYALNSMTETPLSLKNILNAEYVW